MATEGGNEAHIPQGSNALGHKPPDVKGAVTQHHRLATGQKVDGQTNPNGVGTPSKSPFIANGNKGW